MSKIAYLLLCLGVLVFPLSLFFFFFGSIGDWTKELLLEK
jgi:hypothetical protein